MQTKVLKEEYMNLFFRSMVLMFLFFSYATSLLYSQVNSRGKLVSQYENQKFIVELTSNRVSIDGRIILIGEGEYPINGQIAHSGKIDNISSSQIVLNYLEELHVFNIAANTILCANRVQSNNLNDFEVGGNATVQTDLNSNEATLVHNRCLEFTVGMGTELIDFECASEAVDNQKQLVKEIQILLNELGFNVGAPDGIPGSRTKNAIKKFEKDNGYETTGQISVSLLAKLKLQKEKNH